MLKGSEMLSNSTYKAVEQWLSWYPACKTNMQLPRVHSGESIEVLNSSETSLFHWIISPTDSFNSSVSLSPGYSVQKLMGGVQLQIGPKISRENGIWDQKDRILYELVVLIPQKIVLVLVDEKKTEFNPQNGKKGVQNGGTSISGWTS